ncbi:MAG: hypothetical protein NC181_01840 [Clostridium sp.]|nr:hypothetical protein [Clostridium sp.]MCM1444049.1 hypothetical protein [Candidatus Amulumruptor caecigallinarius]
MNNFKINKKFISLFITGSIVLSGCSNKSIDNGESTIDNFDAPLTTSTEIETMTTLEKITIAEITEPKESQNKEITMIEQTTPEETIFTEIIEEVTISEGQENEDITIIEQTTYENIVTTESFDKSDIEQAVIEEFDTLKNQITNIINSDNVMEFKEDCKNVFITVVDFIFYDGTIKGITFDDLSDTAKEVILKDASTIDELIMKKFPDYKENISDSTSKAYNKAAELIKKGSDNIKEFSKEKLGEDNYNKIKEFKDKFKNASSDVWQDMKEDTKDIYESSKEKIKNWYGKFKGVI